MEGESGPGCFTFTGSSVRQRVLFLFPFFVSLEGFEVKATALLKTKKPAFDGFCLCVWVKGSRLCLQRGLPGKTQGISSAWPAVRWGDNFFPQSLRDLGERGDEQLLVGTVTLWMYFVCFEGELAEFTDGLGVLHVA